MQNTFKQATKAVGKEKSIIERAMDSGKLTLKPTNENDTALDLSELIDSSLDGYSQSSQRKSKTAQEKETERITMAIQAVEIKLLQDRVAELKTHLTRSEIRCNKLVKEKKQLIEILSENKPKPEQLPKKIWSSFWK